jgi:hypothetical protein
MQTTSAHLPADEMAKLDRFLRAHVTRFVLGVVNSPPGETREGFIAAVRDFATSHGRRFQHYALEGLNSAETWLRFEEQKALGTIFLITGLYSEMRAEPSELALLFNLQRERIATLLPGPVLMVLDERDLRQFLTDAPDFADWRAAEFNLEAEPQFDIESYRYYLRRESDLPLLITLSDVREAARRPALQSIFVPQSVREAIPGTAIHLRARNQLQDVGYYRFEEPGVEPDDGLARPVTSVIDLLARNSLVVVLGDPGSGKSSLLRYLAWAWATRTATDSLSEAIPFLVDLKKYVRSSITLERYLAAELGKFGLHEFDFGRLLADRQCAIYLDGLDQIFDWQARESMVSQIAGLAHLYPLARIVVTSRIIGYRPTLVGAEFAHATLESFNNSQVKLFLQRWHAVAFQEDHERIRYQSRLERALDRSQSLRELAGSPLLLTMLAFLNREQELPHTRVDLYRAATNIFLRSWDTGRALHLRTFGRGEQEGFLREVAWNMLANDSKLSGNVIDRQALVHIARHFLEELGVSDVNQRAESLVWLFAERISLLNEVGADQFSFVHLTFLEYFCAESAVERFQPTLLLAEKIFRRRLRDSSWHEVLRLIVGMVELKQAQELIAFLMDQNGQESKLSTLILAAECLGERRDRSRLQRLDEQLRARLLAEIVGVCNLESQEETEEIAASRRAVSVLASLWHTESTRSWLVSMMNDPDQRQRIAAVQELARGWPQDPEIQVLLWGRARSDESDLVRRVLIEEVARVSNGNPDAGRLLADRARSDASAEVRTVAIVELARGWRDEPGTPLLLIDRARSDSSAGVRKAALRELAQNWKDDSEIWELIGEMPGNR